MHFSAFSTHDSKTLSSQRNPYSTTHLLSHNRILNPGFGDWESSYRLKSFEGSWNWLLVHFRYFWKPLGYSQTSAYLACFCQFLWSVPTPACIQKWARAPSLSSCQSFCHGPIDSWIPRASQHITDLRDYRKESSNTSRPNSYWKFWLFM